MPHLSPKPSTIQTRQTGEVYLPTEVWAEVLRSMKDWTDQEDLRYVWMTLRLVCRGFKAEIESQFHEELIKLTTLEVEFGMPQHRQRKTPILLKLNKPNLTLGAYWQPDGYWESDTSTGPRAPAPNLRTASLGFSRFRKNDPSQAVFSLGSGPVTSVADAYLCHRFECLLWDGSAAEDPDAEDISERFEFAPRDKLCASIRIFTRYHEVLKQWPRSDLWVSAERQEICVNWYTMYSMFFTK